MTDAAPPPYDDTAPPLLGEEELESEGAFAPDALEPDYPYYRPYSAQDRSSFAFETVSRRWPTILTQVIDTVFRASDHGPYADPAILAEGTELIRRLSDLKYDVSRNAVMAEIPDDGGANIDLYNGYLERLVLDGQNTWFSAPWLYAECYLYRILRTIFALSKHWRAFDPFAEQKDQTFRQSGKAVHDLAEMMANLEPRRDQFRADERKIEALFYDTIQFCLWGNSIDLSLLTSLDLSSLDSILSASSAALADRKRFILKDDISEAWEHIRHLRGARLDIILDNAGFELFTDMILADFLVTYTPYIGEVVFHPKTLPWFVSDVVPSDFSVLLSALTQPTYFGTPPSPAILALAARWQTYVEDGTFTMSVANGKAVGEQMGESVPGGADWWVSPGIYGMMDEAESGREALRALEGSGLVVFKGDLNYRKLTGDVRWPTHTPFRTAIGPLAGRFPLLSLRTNKADVCVGLPLGLAERLEQVERKKDWRWSGQYALISFCPQDSQH